MAEATVLVCDVDGSLAVDTAKIVVDGKTFLKDLCQEHLDQLLEGTRPARPGRRKRAQTAKSK